MYYKYPKTMHLPWSPGLQNDDRVITTLDHFKGEEVVVAEKMDGENTTLYNDNIHARSIDGRHHPSRDWVKGLHGSVRHLIPSALRICGENMYAEHSVRYESLESYFLAFGVWEADTCWDWDSSVALWNELGLSSVPVIFRGSWEEFRAWYYDIEPIWDHDAEGYVVRATRAFQRNEFQQVVAKYVRKNHVQTDQHWMAKAVVPNGLRAD